MTPIKAKAGDAIRIDKQLSEGSTRTSGPLDLTGKTVRVYVQHEEDAIVANTEVEYVDREQGQVAIELAPSQTSNIGRHSIEWVVDPQTDPTTYPADGYDTLETVSPLDRELTPTTDVPPDLTVTNLTVEGDVALGGGNLTGVGTLDATSLDADGASVTSAPTANTDVVRKQEAELKADLTAPDGVLQSSQVPDLSITETFTVTDEAARLSLNVQEGDVAIQTSNNTTYIFTGGDPAVNSNWSTIQLDVLEAIDGSDITPSSVTTPAVNTTQQSLKSNSSTLDREVAHHVSGTDAWDANTWYSYDVSGYDRVSIVYRFDVTDTTSQLQMRVFDTADHGYLSLSQDGIELNTDGSYWVLTTCRTEVNVSGEYHLTRGGDFGRWDTIVGNSAGHDLSNSADESLLRGTYRGGTSSTIEFQLDNGSANNWFDFWIIGEMY